jgi:hypothetical protein
MCVCVCVYRVYKRALNVHTHTHYYWPSRQSTAGLIDFGRTDGEAAAVLAARYIYARRPRSAGRARGSRIQRWGVTPEKNYFFPLIVRPRRRPSTTAIIVVAGSAIYRERIPYGCL